MTTAAHAGPPAKQLSPAFEYAASRLAEDPFDPDVLDLFAQAGIPAERARLYIQWEQERWLATPQHVSPEARARVSHVLAVSQGRATSDDPEVNRLALVLKNPPDLQARLVESGLTPLEAFRLRKQTRRAFQDATRQLQRAAYRQAARLTPAVKPTIICLRAARQRRSPNFGHAARAICGGSDDGEGGSSDGDGPADSPATPRLAHSAASSSCSARRPGSAHV